MAVLIHPLGLRVGKEDKLIEVLWQSPAFRAGWTRGLTLLAVNLLGR
jgi:predicted metalloprotease with PDZ domain